MRKTAKSPQDFADQEPSLSESLEIFDKKANTNKFWRVRVYGRFLIREWGRHGTKGQNKVEDHFHQWDAEDAARKLIASKRKKGYVAEAGVLEKFVREVD